MVKDLDGDSNTTIEELKQMFGKFIADRQWERFHHPKNIAESICIEAAELLELFQWRSVEEIQQLMRRKDFKERVAEELSDVTVYLLSMANAIDIDLTDSIVKKIEKNESRYPTEKYQGKAHIED